MSSDSQDKLIANLHSVFRGMLLPEARRDLLVKKGLITRGTHRDFLTDSGRKLLEESVLGQTR